MDPASDSPESKKFIDGKAPQGAFFLRLINQDHFRFEPAAIRPYKTFFKC